jgi:hypothetical protein
MYGKVQCGPMFVYESLAFASYIRAKLRAKKGSIIVKP